MSLFTDPDSLTEDERDLGTKFAPRFDAHGLIMAIATDQATSQVLMVAYMTEESLQKTLLTGDVYYFSRSRQKLWKKGETSGEIQKLVEMRTDCDQDVILMKVEQTGRGAACHTGHKSCFFRRLEQQDGSVTLVRDDEGPLFDPKEVYAGS